MTSLPECRQLPEDVVAEELAVREQRQVGFQQVGVDRPRGWLWITGQRKQINTMKNDTPTGSQSSSDFRDPAEPPQAIRAEIEC